MKLLRRIGLFWSESPPTFSARSFVTDCPYCEIPFEFELGWLLSHDIDPVKLKSVVVRCPNCRERLSVHPKDVRTLYDRPDP